MKVVKRDGRTQDFNISKIKVAISFACEGLDVNPLELESKFDGFIFDGVTTESIQENLILHAKNLASPQNDKWLLVAGRLATMSRWGTLGSYKKPFTDYVKDQINNGEWKHENFKLYSEKDLKLIGEMLVKDRDLQHTIASVETANSKYLNKNECIQTLFMGNAMLYASVESTADQRMKRIKEFYELLSNLEGSLASPNLMNARKGLNNASCFILAPNDDVDSIFNAIKDVALISKNGGGLGWFLGYIRAKGSSLMDNPTGSGGVLPLCKVINDVLVYINQSGRRKGAGTLALPIWHNDITDFLDIQTEVGDPRSKSFDIQPQVTIFDLFMQKVESNMNGGDEDWYTFCPHEVKTVLGIDICVLFNEDFNNAYRTIVDACDKGLLKVYTKHKVKSLWIKYLQVFFEKGRPYPTFIDAINRANPNKHDGVILCGNLCQESFSNTKPDVYHHTCSLMSLVVGRIAIKDLSDKASLAVRMLNNAMMIGTTPVEESANHLRDYRTIGIGIQGLCDIIAREWKSYSDLKFITEVCERIQYGAVRESIEMAKEYGAFPKFKGSRWDVGDIFDEYNENSVCPDLDWLYLKGQCQLYGIYNSQLTSPAPNTSTSIFMMAGAGFMPSYAPYFYEDNMGGKTPVSSMYLQENPLFYSQTLGHYDQAKLTQAVGAGQKFVDTGISAEYLLDRNIHNITAIHVRDLVFSMWKNGCKTGYYLRTIKKGEAVKKTDDTCVACAG